MSRGVRLLQRARIPSSLSNASGRKLPSVSFLPNGSSALVRIFLQVLPRLVGWQGSARTLVAVSDYSEGGNIIFCWVTRHLKSAGAQEARMAGGSLLSSGCSIKIPSKLSLSSQTASTSYNCCKSIILRSFVFLADKAENRNALCSGNGQMGDPCWEDFV